MRKDRHRSSDDLEDQLPSTINDNDLGGEDGGVDNVCLNIDKYLDDLEKSMDTNKHAAARRSNSNSLPSTSTDYKNWSMASKCSRRPSYETGRAPRISADPNETFITFPFENTSSSSGNLRLIWRNVTYQSKSKTSVSGRRFILSKQNGEIIGGQLTAIIGPSGAGKSTLLESLAGRRQRGLKGQIMIAYDRDYVDDPGKIRISFIGQKDQLIGVLTVRETLMFASRIKNYNRIKNYYYHPRLVDSILKSLNLETCSEVRVSRISGGQLKRLTFAIELISGPDILMLDEPTSGLDSSSTYQCIGLLRKLTDLKKAASYFRPPAIVCSIHQPSARVLSIFHQIYVLSADGRCLYQGSPKSLIPHLTKHDLNCPQFHNPADFIIEIASGDYGSEPINRLAVYEANKRLTMSDEKIYHLPHKKLNLPASSEEKMDELFDDQLAEEEIRISKEKRIKVHQVVAKMKSNSFPIFSHFWLLLGRTYLTTVRDPKLTWFRIFQAIFVGLLMSFLYDHPIGEASGCYPSSLPTFSSTPAPGSVNLTHNLEHAVAATQDNIAFIFFITLFTVMACMMPTVLTFPAEVSVHIQERNNGWYSCWTYYWTKIIADTPYQVAITTLFCSIVYPMTGQVWEEKRFCLFIFISVLVSNIAQCVGMLFGTLYVRSVQNAVFMAPLSMAPVFLLSGFFGKISKVPIFLKPIATISYVRYAFEAFLIVIYGLDRCPPVVYPSASTVFLSNQNRGNFRGSASEDSLATEAPPDYDEGNSHDNILADVATTTTIPSYLDDTSNDTPPLYDSLPKIWAGFYNPLDYLSLAPKSLASSVSSSSSKHARSIILQHFELSDDDLWKNIIILLASLTLLRLLAYLILIYKTNERK